MAPSNCKGIIETLRSALLYLSCPLTRRSGKYLLRVSLFLRLRACQRRGRLDDIGSCSGLGYPSVLTDA